MSNALNGKELPKIFYTTKQEKLRLQAALQGYFAGRYARKDEADHTTDTDVIDETDNIDDIDNIDNTDNTDNTVIGPDASAVRRDYEAYIRKRIRPAAEELLEQGEIAALMELIRDGLMPESVREALTLRCAREGRTAAWLRLMNLRDGTEQNGTEQNGTEQNGTAQNGTAQDGTRHNEEDSDRTGIQGSAGPQDTDQTRQALQILQAVRRELYELFPFLDCVMAALPFREDEGAIRTKTIGTDGRFLFFDPAFIIQAEREAHAGLTRLCLHTLLHCMLRHWDGQTELFCGTGDKRAESRRGAEAETGHEARKGTGEKTGHEARTDTEEKIGREAETGEEDKKRAEAKKEFLDRMVESMIEAECGRRPLCRARLGERPDDCPDDHSLWLSPNEKADPARRRELRQKWEMLGALGGLGAGIGPGGGGFGRDGAFGIGVESGTKTEEIGRIRRSHSDYRRFLSRFAVMREEMELDLDSFDYIYYALGMERCGGLPLIEPLEYKEGHKLSELVIAIDTSGSCSADMIRRFLEESYAILGQKENFFKRMKVYFIQCDCTVQDVKLIQNEADWRDYCEHLQIKGRSGTDFTPVFRYVERLREQKELMNLKCLLYFTDGEGVYPRNAPDYETAFVFVGDGPDREKVPGWAAQLYARDLEL